MPEHSGEAGHAVNSREKGKRGERAWRDELRAAGYVKARRGQQFCGGGDSPDVVCPELERYHFEVKFTQALNVGKAMEQARRDCGQKTPIVAHKRSFEPWLVTMGSETFFTLLRGGITTQDLQMLLTALQSHHSNEPLCPLCECAKRICLGLANETRIPQQNKEAGAE